MGCSSAVQLSTAGLRPAPQTHAHELATPSCAQSFSVELQVPVLLVTSWVRRAAGALKQGQIFEIRGAAACTCTCSWAHDCRRAARPSFDAIRHLAAHAVEQVDAETFLFVPDRACGPFRGKSACESRGTQVPARVPILRVTLRIPHRFEHALACRTAPRRSVPGRRTSFTEGLHTVQVVLVCRLVRNAS